MGKPGGAPPRKAPGTAISHRNGQRAILTSPGERFDPPEHIERPEALQAWDEYWSDPVSSVLTIADRSLLYRWIDLVQRYWTLAEEADANPVINTTANGRLANPLYKIVCSTGNQIEHLEIKLGIGPKSRHGLGVDIINAQDAFDKFNERFPRSSPSDYQDEEDPRLT